MRLQGYLNAVGALRERDGLANKKIADEIRSYRDVRMPREAGTP
jgi:hypothetical protein